METVASEVSYGAQCFPFIPGVYTLRCIFHNKKIMLFLYGEDLVHGTSYARIMHWDDSFRLFCDGIFDQCLVNIHGIRADIHKNDLCSPENESVRR